MTEREEMLRAIAACDATYDGLFVYAVRSTGIYCRPSCRSRTPQAGNIELFDTPEAACLAGFRPCKRCRPDLSPGPDDMLTERARRAIDAHFCDREALKSELSALGLGKRRLTELFRERYHETPEAYAARLRIREARARLERGDGVADTALSVGFESISAFYGAFSRYTGLSPGELRRKKGPPVLNGRQYYTYDTPLGPVSILADDSAIYAVRLTGGEELCCERRANTHTDAAAQQLLEYFSGKRRVFDLPLAPEGTAFQQTVWRALRDIPYGETQSYKQLAEAIQKPGASRAVGMANNKNPILIIIPCHRVIGANGALVGYAGGLAVKRGLLALERGYTGLSAETLPV